MTFSLQSFPITVGKFLTKTLEQEDQSHRASLTMRDIGRDRSQSPLPSYFPSSSLISSVITKYIHCPLLYHFCLSLTCFACIFLIHCLCLDICSDTFFIFRI